MARPRCALRSGRYSVPVLGAVLYSLLGVDTSYYADFGTTFFPNAFPTGAGAAAAYPGYRRANQFNLKDPTVIQWNFSIDHNIGWNTLVRASYTGSHTYNLIYSPDLNQVEPNTIGYAALTATPALRQQNLKYPNFREVLTRANGPSDKYDAVTFEAEQPLLERPDLYEQLHLGEEHHQCARRRAHLGHSAGRPGRQRRQRRTTIYNIAADYGNAYYTPRQRFVSTFVYDLPFGRGKKFCGDVSRGANLVVGGWRVTGRHAAADRAVADAVLPERRLRSLRHEPLAALRQQQRPDCVAGTERVSFAIRPPPHYFNVSAFSIPGQRHRPLRQLRRRHPGGARNGRRSRCPPARRSP